MSGAALAIYHRLPPWLRSAVAGLRGRRLRHWRYGPETDRLVAEARQREDWTLDQWQRWQQERLAFVLHRAATRVPFYRQQWAERRRRGDRSSPEILANWPVLEKETVRRAGAALVADDCRLGRLYAESTSGTTGKPLALWASRATLRAHYALHEARTRGWYGVSRHDRWAILGGQLVARVDSRRPPFWVWNAGLNQLYMSSYHLAPDLMPAYLEALRRYRVAYLLGYTSSLHALAEEALRRGVRDWAFKVAITNAEPVLDHQRRTIGAAFGCPVCETYGMAENVAAASECPAGRLHLWPSTGVVEVLEGAAPVAAGVVADFVCTGLLNADMPLVRYRVGDRGALAEVQERCACGRTLPMLASIEGRRDDLLVTADGRRVGRLDPVFKGDLPVCEAQIIQESLGTLRVRYVPAPQYTAAHGRALVERLRQRMGDVRVELECVERIPRGPRGKFQAVICRLPEPARPVSTGGDD